MPIVCEVPTHLNVSDTIVFGLGAHQLVRLAAGGFVGFLVRDQANGLAPEWRAAIASVLAAAGLACALLQPGGRPLDRWVLAGLLYLAIPRRFAWRRGLRSAVHYERNVSGSSLERDRLSRAVAPVLNVQLIRYALACR